MSVTTGGKNPQDKIRRYYSMIASAHSGPLDEKLVKSIPGLSKILAKEQALLSEKVAAKRKGDDMAMILKEQGNAFMQQITAMQRAQATQQPATTPAGVALHSGEQPQQPGDSNESLYATHGVLCYSQALYKCDIKSELLKAQLHANRAQAFIVLKQFGLGLLDAETAMELQPNFVKAYYRAATCSKELGNLPYAAQLLTDGVKREKQQNPDLQQSDLQNLLTTVQNDLKAMGMSTYPATGPAAALSRRTHNDFEYDLAPPEPFPMPRGSKGLSGPYASLNHELGEDKPSGRSGPPKRPSPPEHTAAIEVLGEDNCIGYAMPDLEDQEEFNRVSIRVGVATVVKRYYHTFKMFIGGLKEQKTDIGEQEAESGVKLLAEAKDALATCKEVHHAAFASKPQRKKLDRLIDEVSSCLSLAMPAACAGLLHDDNGDSIVKLMEPVPPAPKGSKDSLVTSTTNNGKNYLECDRWLQAFLLDCTMIPQNVLEHSFKQQIAHYKNRNANRQNRVKELTAQNNKDKKRLHEQSKTLEKVRKQLVDVTKKEADAQQQMDDFQDFKKAQAAEQEGNVAGDAAALLEAKKKTLEDLKAQVLAAEEAAAEEGEELEQEIAALQQKQEAARARVKLVATLQAARAKAAEAKKAEEAEARRKEIAAAKKEKERLEMLNAKAAADAKKAAAAVAAATAAEDAKEKNNKTVDTPLDWDKEAIKERSKQVPASSVPTIDGAPAKYCERKGEGKKDFWLCYACDRQYSSFEGLRQHVRGSKHKALVLELDPPVPDTPPPEPVKDLRQHQVAGHRLHHQGPHDVEPSSRRKPVDNNAPGWAGPPPPAAHVAPKVGPNGQPTIRVGGSYVVAAADGAVPVPGGSTGAGIQIPAPASASRLDHDAKPFVPAPRSQQSAAAAGAPPPPPPGFNWNPTATPMVPTPALQQQAKAINTPPPGVAPAPPVPASASPPKPKMPRFFRSGTIITASWKEELGVRLMGEYPGCEFDVTRPKFGKKAAISIAATSQTMLRNVVDSLQMKISSEALSLDDEVYRELPNGDMELVATAPPPQQPVAATTQPLAAAPMTAIPAVVQPVTAAPVQAHHQPIATGTSNWGGAPSSTTSAASTPFGTTPGSAGPIGGNTFLQPQSPLDSQVPSFTIFGASASGSDPNVAAGVIGEHKASSSQPQSSGDPPQDWLASALAGNAAARDNAQEVESMWLKGVLDE